jgi:hypothetical protein
MPWKERSVMDERVRFVARLLDGEKMAAICREFAISRKTGFACPPSHREYRDSKRSSWNQTRTEPR